jgi:hypothetical protein
MPVNNADVTKAGVALPAETNGDPVNHHVINNDGNVIIIARNSNGAAVARNLTIRFKGAVDGQGITPKVHSIPAGASRVYGPYDTTNYGTAMEIDVDNAEIKLYTLRVVR